ERVQSCETLIRRLSRRYENTCRIGDRRSILKNFEGIVQSQFLNQLADLLAEGCCHRTQCQFAHQASDGTTPYEQIGNERVSREAPERDGREKPCVMLFIRDDGLQELDSKPEQDFVPHPPLREEIYI